MSNATRLIQSHSMQVSLSIEEKRASIPVGLRVEDIQNMSQQHLFILQKHFGFGDEWGVIELPSEWCHKGGSQKYGKCRVQNRLEKWTSNKEDVELAVITAVRLLLLSITVVSSTSSMRPTTILKPRSAFKLLTSQWLTLLKDAVCADRRKEGVLFGRLNRSENKKYKDKLDLAREIKRLDSFSERKLWNDTVEDLASKHNYETSNRGKSQYLAVEKNREEYRPLPDAFVHAAGQIAAWITEHLMPIVLQAFEETIKIRTGTSALTHKATTGFLKEYRWKTTEGKPISFLPVKLQNVTWPPRNWDGLLSLVRLGQQAHYFIIALSAGPRASEILSFDTNCLIETNDGILTVQGRTFKLVDSVAGAMRDWPMPKMAALAILQQIRLSKLVTSREPLKYCLF